MEICHEGYAWTSKAACENTEKNQSLLFVTAVS